MPRSLIMYRYKSAIIARLWACFHVYLQPCIHAYTLRTWRMDLIEYWRREKEGWEIRKWRDVIVRLRARSSGSNAQIPCAILDVNHYSFCIKWFAYKWALGTIMNLYSFSSWCLWDDIHKWRQSIWRKQDINVGVVDVVACQNAFLYKVRNNRKKTSFTTTLKYVCMHSHFFCASYTQ